MNSNKIFTNTVDILTSLASGENPDSCGLWPGSKAVTPESFRDFEKQYILDCLKGWRYGQSFCHYFGIPNASPLYYFKDTLLSKRWIKYNYLNNEAEIC